MTDLTTTDIIDGSRNTNNKDTATKNSRSTVWCLTINNYDSDDIEFLKSLKTKVTCFQTEIGTSGTPHIQGCIRFGNARYFNSLKKMFPKAHIERCRNFAASCNYCQKQDTWDGKIRFYKARDKIILDINEGNGKIEGLQWTGNGPTEEWLHDMGTKFMSWIIAKNKNVITNG